MKDGYIETRTSKISLLEESIVLIEEKQGAEIILHDAIEVTKTVSEIVKQGRWGILTDLRSIKSISKEARDYYSKNEMAPGRVAIALLIDSYFSKVMANFFIGFSKPITPTQMFTSKEEAIEWLKQMIG